METAVEKLEAMFQKSEADMEYIERKLKLDYICRANEGSVPDSLEYSVKLLENLSAIKARHAALCTQVKEIATMQKESMDSIRDHLNTTLQLVQQMEHIPKEEVLPLTESEQLAVEAIGSGLASVCHNTTEVPSSSKTSTQGQPQSFKDLSEGTLEAGPSNVMLADLKPF